MADKSINPYQSFPNFVLRTPLLPLNFFTELCEGDEITDEKLKEAFKNEIIQEAIFLASPSLYDEALKWADEDKKDDKLKYAILKYIARMSSRCTPFGLFAGCALGKIDDNTEMILKAPAENKRHTRLDMNYLVALSQDLIKNKDVRNQLLFYPNSSIYRTGEQLRYVEYKYVNSRRHHHIVAVDHSEYLQAILEKAKKGAYLRDLAESLVDEEISIEEASEFINELVESQLLISELEPSVSGPEFLGQIQAVLKKLKNTEPLIKLLTDADQKIGEIDKTIGNSPKKYIDLSEDLKNTQTAFELKFLFQTDMQLSYAKNTLDKDLVSSVKKGITLLNKLSLPPKETLLSRFKDAFYERYEEREVLLANALDIEIGVGYRQNQGSGDVSPLVDDLVLPARNNANGNSELTWNSFQNVLHKKMIDAFKNDTYTIAFSDDDFKNFNQNSWEDLPDTMSCMVELVHIDGEQKIQFSGSGGSSAANLLGRFCHGDVALNDYTQSIIDTEAQINKDKILAEIVHLPESRVGNILMRPAFRKYEIPYLAKSILDTDQQLTLDDLMISVKNNRTIFLRSKRENKEVIPHLTNAHNYSANSLPIYHFLSDMQTQGLRGGVYFNAGPFENEYEFIPRITYENIILKEASWNIKKAAIEPLLKVMNDNAKFKKELKSFVDSRKIPNYVMLKDGDNELLVNFNNLTSAKMLLDTVKKRGQFKITEFLFDKDSIVKSKEGYYTNQLVISFYNENKLTDSKK